MAGFGSDFLFLTVEDGSCLLFFREDAFEERDGRFDDDSEESLAERLRLGGISVLLF